MAIAPRILKLFPLLRSDLTPYTHVAGDAGYPHAAATSGRVGGGPGLSVESYLDIRHWDALVTSNSRHMSQRSGAQGRQEQGEG